MRNADSKDLNKTASAGESSKASRGGVHVDGPNGFLWKPASESNGKLVVLLPSQMTGKVDSVTVRDAAGRAIEQGRQNGVANGGREHFRFNRTGSDYPHNCVVEVRMKDGSVKTYQISDPSARHD